MVGRSRVLLVVLLMLSLLTACLPSGESAQREKLTIGVLPIIEVIPLYVAQQEGFFEKHGLDVEVVLTKGAQERDALMQAGELDAMWTDPVAVGLFNRETPQVVVVAKGYYASSDLVMFQILGAPESGLTSAADLVGVPIGLSQNTVAQYITERLLTTEGLAPEEIEVVEISAIPVRFEQLMEGQVQAAAIPDPLGRGAIANGAVPLVKDTAHPQYSQGVIAFRKNVVDDDPELVKRFLLAWDESVDALRSNPDAYRDMLIEKGRVPESIQSTYAVPLFPLRDITSQEEWRDVVEWMLDKGLLDEPLSYEGSVDTSFFVSGSQ
jgi:NitT/TauT family transport system substrate-binding protein